MTEDNKYERITNPMSSHLFHRPFILMHFPFDPLYRWEKIGKEERDMFQGK